MPRVETWFGMTRHCLFLLGMAWAALGSSWHGLGVSLTFCAVICSSWHCLALLGMVWHGFSWHDLARYLFEHVGDIDVVGNDTHLHARNFNNKNIPRHERLLWTHVRDVTS